MSVHNGAATVGSAIRSLLWQTFSDWELLIVNDASTDATLQICRQFQDSRIRLVDESQRRGLAARLNQCINHARGTYVARMDADDIAYPERFERQILYLKSHPHIDLLGHGAVLFKGDGQVIGVYPTACEHDEICSRPWWGFPLAHPTWMGKRSWFSCHPYSEDLIKGQDQELLLRSYRTSRFAALPDILLGYRMEGISVKKSWWGRLSYCRQLVRQISDGPSGMIAARGIFVHGLAFSRDVLLDASGSLNQRSRQSFQAADDDVINQWQRTWNRATSGDAIGFEPAFLRS